MEFNIEGYTIQRFDRLIRKGGGSALAIKSNLIGKEISLENLLNNDYATGFLMSSGKDHIAIFSIYSTPSSTVLNTRILNFIQNNYKTIMLSYSRNTVLAPFRNWFGTLLMWP